ncbi:MAG: HEAT repeat domain-containing protein [Deltaproteobacteria bacterium]|nr:HEAT repeat domain-containing protein [Deltaproteobacteria bacterium]
MQTPNSITSPLQKIREALEGSSEDARYQAWMTLYRAEQAEYGQELDRILQEKDPILKIKLARFLAQIPESKAVQLLAVLLLSENLLVFEAAKKAFEKNALEKKAKFLLFLLQDPSLEKRLFAIEKLAQANIYDALPHFIQQIQKAEEIEKIALLKAFRYLAEPKVFPLLRKMFEDKNTKLRLEVLFALIKLYEEGHWRSERIILRALQDESAELRRVALWGLRQRPKRRHWKCFEFCFVHDQELYVREEALKGLCCYSQEKTIRLLLQTIGQEKNPGFALKIEARLLALPQEKLKKVFWKLANKKIFFENTRVLFYLALLQKKSQKVFKFLIKKIAAGAAPKQQVLLLEALVEIRLPEAIKLFEAYLNESPLETYYALLGIIRLMKEGIPVPLESYFDKNLLSPFSQEVLLKELLKMKQKPLSEKKLMALLSYSEANAQLSITYLAALNLIKISSEAGVERMLRNCALQKDFPLLESFQKMITCFFKENPEFVFRLLEKNHEKEVTALLFKILSELDWSAERLEKVFPALFLAFRSGCSSYLQKDFFYFLQGLLYNQKSGFQSLMSTLQLQEQHGFLDSLNTAPSDLLLHIKSEEFSEIFFSAPPEIQNKMLRLCSEKKHASFYSFAVSLISRISDFESEILKNILSDCIVEQTV